MPQPIILQSDAIALTNSATRYTYFFGGDWWTTVSEAAQVMSHAGIISQVRLELSAAPSSGKSWTFTLVKNEVDTALTVTIANTDTVGTNTGTSVSFAAGDVLCWKSVPSGTPTSASLLKYYFEIAPATPGTSQWGQTVQWTTNTTKVQPMCFLGAFTPSGGNEVIGNLIVPTDGNFVATYGHQNGTGTAATGYTLTLNKNGVDQDGTGGTVDTRVSFDFQSTKSTSGGTYTLPVVAGDQVYLKATVVGTPSLNKKVSLSVSFRASNASEYIIPNSLKERLLPDSGSPLYIPYSMGSTTNPPSPSTTEPTMTFFNSRPLNLTKLYVWLVSGPGAGTRQFTTRKNSSDQTQVITMTGSGKTGSDTANGHKVRITSGDTFELKMATIASFSTVTSGVFAFVAEYIGGGKNVGTGSFGGGGGLTFYPGGANSLILNPGVHIGSSS